MDTTMNCDPDPPQDKVAQSVWIKASDALLSIDGENTALTVDRDDSKIIELTAKDCAPIDHSETLERHNFQALELDLQLNEMSLKFKTHQSLEPQVYALLGQLSVLQNDLKHQQEKLDLANRTVGFLDAQVRVQQAQIEELRLALTTKSNAKSNLIVKLFDRFATRL